LTWEGEKRVDGKARPDSPRQKIGRRDGVGDRGEKPVLALIQIRVEDGRPAQQTA